MTSNDPLEHISAGEVERAVIEPDLLGERVIQHLALCERCTESVGRFAVALARTPLEQYPVAE